MKSISVEEKILAKYESDMRKNEDAFLVIRNKTEDLDKQEDELYDIKLQFKRFCDEQRITYAGTEDFARYNQLESDLDELASMSKKLLERNVKMWRRKKSIFTCNKKSIMRNINQN